MTDFRPLSPPASRRLLIIGAASLALACSPDVFAPPADPPRLLEVDGGVGKAKGRGEIVNQGEIGDPTRGGTKTKFDFKSEDKGVDRDKADVEIENKGGDGKEDDVQFKARKEDVTLFRAGGNMVMMEGTGELDKTPGWMFYVVAVDNGKGKEIEDWFDVRLWNPTMGSTKYAPDYRFHGVVTKGEVEVKDSPPIPPLAEPDNHATAMNTILWVRDDGEFLTHNDDLGLPFADITSIGGGHLGGTVADYPAGELIWPIPTWGSGALLVSPDGTFGILPPQDFVGPFTFYYRLTNAAGMSDGAVTIHVLGPPTAVDDAYSASGNIAIALDAANGVLTNDLANGPTVTQVQGGGAATIGVPTGTSAIGRGGVPGYVTMAGDGGFAYQPPPGFEGIDTFTYTIDDPFGGDHATVTVQVNDMVWFIDNSAATTANRGTFAAPFASIADLNAAQAGTGALTDPKPGDVIALRTGTGTYAEADGINLLNDQQLIGGAFPLSGAFVADPSSSADYHAFAAATGLAPLIEVTGPDNNGVDLATNNTVRGLDIGSTNITGTNSFGMFGDAVGNLVVNTVSIMGDGGALDLADGDLGDNVIFDRLSSSNALRVGLRLTGLTGVLAVNDAGSSITGSGWQSVRVGGGSLSMDYPGLVTNDKGKHIVEVINTLGGSLVFSGTVSQARPSGKGVIIDNAAGDVTFADLDLGTPEIRNGGLDAGVLITNSSSGTFTFHDLDVYVTGAGNAALKVENGTSNGRVEARGATLDSDAAPAVDAMLMGAAGPGSLLVIEESRIVTTDPLAHAVEIDAQGVATAAVTLMGNSVMSAGANTIDVTTHDTGTLCLDIRKNSAGGSGMNYALTNAGGTFAVEGPGAAPVTALDIENQNNTGTASVAGTINYSNGVDCQ